MLMFAKSQKVTKDTNACFRCPFIRTDKAVCLAQYVRVGGAAAWLTLLEENAKPASLKARRDK